MSRGIFHKRGEIMALTSLKARTGIAALTFAAAVVPPPAKAAEIIDEFDSLTVKVHDAFSLSAADPAATLTIVTTAHRIRWRSQARPLSQACTIGARHVLGVCTARAVS